MAEDRREEIRKAVEDAREEMARLPSMTFDFAVTRTEGADGTWSGPFTVVFGGQRHGWSLDGADDASAIVALEALGRYVERILELASEDVLSGTPRWTEEEREAAAAFAKALQR
jgi:hypothetical protein